jgi:restriction system protein
MARRKKASGIDVVASLPWPAGLALGLFAFWAIRYGPGWYFSTNGGPLLKGLGQMLSKGAYAPFAWLALVAGWIAAAASFLKSRHRRAPLDTQTGLDSIAAMSWREFEMLVGEAFRRRGYQIEETGLGGADGGIDLILRKSGRTELVQCKQWRTRHVKVPVVREMWGLVAHHHADGVKIVCVGEFTPDAAEFAEDKPIELINGKRLLELVREAQMSERIESAIRSGRAEPVFTTQSTRDQVTCPTCDAVMVLRKNRSTRAEFMGCTNYPRCKGTRPLKT